MGQISSQVHHKLQAMIGMCNLLVFAGYLRTLGAREWQQDAGLLCSLRYLVDHCVLEEAGSDRPLD